MLITLTSTLLLLSFILAAWAIHSALGLRRQFAELERDRESLRLTRDENDQLRRLVNYSQHTRQSLEMLEDLAAVFSDIDRELSQSFRYVFARLKNADHILASGRPGPLAYKASNTKDRPARPGLSKTPVKLWNS